MANNTTDIIEEITSITFDKETKSYEYCIVNPEV
jgi:hypothetical protein